MSRTRKQIQEIYEVLGEMYPNARPELEYSNVYELTVAVMLSAQTTDQKVNSVTSILFKKYPNIYVLNEANETDLYEMLRPLGLAKNKSRSLKKMAHMVCEEFDGQIPSSMEDLCKLPGVGRKCASVILVCYYHVPAFPVDTHVHRTSVRLGIANEDDSLLEVEQKVCKGLDYEQYYSMHHRMIFFGRYRCKSMHPLCEDCKLSKYCRLKNRAN